MLLLRNLFKVQPFYSLESDRFYLTQLSCWHNEELKAAALLLRGSATVDCSKHSHGYFVNPVARENGESAGWWFEKKTHTLCSKGFDVAQAPANTSTTAAATTPTPQPAASSRPLYSTVRCALPDYGRPYFTSFVSSSIYPGQRLPQGRVGDLGVHLHLKPQSSRVTPLIF